MSSPKPLRTSQGPSRAVKLNVGGKRYVTTEATLLTHGPNYFTGLLSGKYANETDDEGWILLDRNGRLFEPILEFLRTGELSCTGYDQKAVIREMKFYCIDAQRFTDLSDDSIRDIVHSARYSQFQDSARQYEAQLRSLASSVLTAFRDSAEAARPVQTPVFLPPLAMFRRALDEWKQSKHIAYTWEPDFNNLGETPVFLSDAEWDFLASQRNCEVLLWHLKEAHSVTCEAREYASGFLASYDGLRHQYALEGSFLRPVVPSVMPREGAVTSPIVTFSAWRLVWTDPARRYCPSPTRPPSVLGFN